MRRPSPVSVIIPHLNQADALERCLASLAAQSRRDLIAEIIVVDNGSTGGLAPLAARFPQAHWLEEKTPGPGPARNLGIAHASGDIIALIDADCRAHPEWIAALTRRLENEAADCIVGGDVKIDFHEAERASGIEAYEAVFAYRQQLYITRHGFSGTGNLAFRRPVHMRVGPFAGIGTAEDRDWGQRARRLGLPIVYEPEMIVYHPARLDQASLETKWRRHIAHVLDHHRQSGGSLLVWTARAVAVLLSAVAHTPKMLLSSRLEGRSGRWRGLKHLYAIRAFRAIEMIRQARDAGNAAAEWNRP